MALIPITITGVEIEQTTGSPVMLLREDVAPNRILPIFVGPHEARAISVALAGLQPPRPGTHDLLVDALSTIGMRVREVDVTELRNGTFIAELVLTGDNGDHRVSSRPSDAVALAVRVDAPLFADESVLAEAGVLEADDDLDDDPVEVAELTQEDIDATVEQLEDFLASLGDSSADEAGSGGPSSDDPDDPDRSEGPATT